MARVATRRVVPRQLRARYDLRTERHLLEGRLSVPDSGPQSVVFFTVHKCASTFMRKATAHIAKTRLQLRPVNMARYYWEMKDGDVYEQLQNEAANIFHHHGFLYGPLRQPLDIPGIEAFRPILMLRDPRDVLTSFYYSITISHGLPVATDAREQFTEVRRQWADMTIDEFVLGWLPEFQRRYDGYLDLRNETGCPLLRYEDMLSDFDQWANDLAQSFGLTFSTEEVTRLRRMGGFDRDVSESASRHIRQRTPGDHVRKLAPATVEQITEELGPVLEGFGYV